ncbi:beta-ketoacyl-ACP synthase [Chamaesiphon minutus]|uniref:3-oxoacyl-(Acyl-carrier-protein) synthase n=1 Tax=Chamaesiphon minutus (strain ATCC 27169 / PCC 6605) TaxID=1173020 RepID=K9U8C8_CHAP6|nr:beta-ketoacyl-ACP synthase [Chamaesiphon minutus]AFY91312.1 3-oxoacyl-(acyl-carrier-protein) synthase [Chamaesiphon minutus PCC 6605]
MQVVITGIGFRSALGNLTDTWQAAIDDRSAIRWHRPFADLSPLPLALIATQPQHVLDLTLTVVAEAVRDAGLSLPLPDCGVAIGSSRSCQSQWEHFTANLPNEPDLTNWLDTLPHSPAIATAKYIGSRSAVLAPMAACATGIWSIAQAVNLMRSGACERAIAGAVEAPITPLTIAGFTQMGALATTGCYPFDVRREGLVLGEAGAVLILETAELARSRGAKIYGEILGFGLTNDAYHMCAMDESGTAGEKAIWQCLERSHLSPADIDYIHAHGTSTPLNDRRESQLIQQIFPDGVAISSTKGATGHTLGASGAVGVAFCLQAIATQTLPPCVGLKNPEFDLDLVTVPRQTDVNNLLCLSFGFGGQNTAIALKKC